MPFLDWRLSVDISLFMVLQATRNPPGTWYNEKLYFMFPVCVWIL